MSKSRIKNAVIVMENDVECLFGEVVEDSRFEKGHHIKSSPLISSCTPILMTLIFGAVTIESFSTVFFALIS